MYTIGFGKNRQTDTDWLRYEYESPLRPPTTYELDMKTGKRRMLKREEVLGGFDRDNYATERVWAEARDGTKIPVSLVWRKGYDKDGSAPAKWVAKLRAKKTDDNALVLSVNMDAGHGGASGRFERQEEVARDFAFILQQFGMTE